MVRRAQGRGPPLGLGRGLELLLVAHRVKVKGQAVVMVMHQAGVWLGEGGPRWVCCLAAAQLGGCPLQGYRLQGQARCLGVGVGWWPQAQPRLAG